MSGRLAPLLLGLAMLLSWPLGPVPAEAQVPAEPLKIGLFVNQPFVMEEDGQFTGMAVELWEAVAAGLGADYAYTPYASIQDLLDATEAGAVDVAVTDISITRSRAHRVDFTQPWLDGGDRIMVRDDDESGVRDLLAGLGDAGFLKAYFWIAFVIIAATVALTLFDRRFDAGFPKRWRDGIAESFYTVMSIATSGKPPARKNLFGWLGRIWQGLWLVSGIAVLAFVTSSVTSVMTTLSLTGQINSLDDLFGAPVAVMRGTVQEAYARREGLSTRPFDGFRDALQALERGEVVAIVHDAPVLEYYVHQHPEEPVKVVGRLFNKAKYGFALPRKSELTKPLTIELLGILERGEVTDLHTRYFGPDG